MKKLIKYIKIFVIASVAIMLTACSDWLDVNSNPYSANENANLSPGYLFNYAVTTHSSNRQGGDFYVPVLIAGQTVADGGFNDHGGWWGSAKYDISTYATGNTWVTLYANSSTNLVKAKEFAEKSTELIDKERKNAIAQCNIMLALNFFELTTMYGDVPCSESFDLIKYPTPKFESQESVLGYSLSLLDDAIATIDVNSDGIGEYDIIYEGNMNKWLELAKSLKLRTLLVMVDKDPSRASEIGDMVKAGGFIAEGNDCAFPFFSTSGTQNPNYRLNLAYATPGSSYMFFAHNVALSRMQAYNDPRIPIYFLPGDDGVYRGLDTSEDVEMTPSGKYLSSPVNYQRVWKATQPDLIFTYSEISFLLSEIYAKGVGVSKDMAKAQTYFVEGVKASCSYWEVSEANLTQFLANLPNISTMSEGDALKTINDQSWIALMFRPFEAWLNQRRTEIPALSIPKAAPYTKLIYRWQYPPRETSVNPNIPNPLPQITDKMWFQK
jgi:hypothetical protein